MRRLRLSDIPDACSVQEAASIIGVGKNTCYELIREGALQSVRAGRRIIVPKVALDRFLHRCIAADGSQESSVEP